MLSSVSIAVVRTPGLFGSWVGRGPGLYVFVRPPAQFPRCRDCLSLLFVAVVTRAGCFHLLSRTGFSSL